MFRKIRLMVLLACIILFVTGCSVDNSYQHEGLSDGSAYTSGSSATAVPTAKPTAKPTAIPTAAPTAIPTKPPKSEAEVKFEEAERLFALGRYDEAITIYDEITPVMDVEARRAYAIECRDIRDLYFIWVYDDGQLMLTEYVGFGMDTVIIPYGTRALHSRIFSGKNPDIISVQLPDTLTEIPLGCFSGCSNLTNINIPSSIKSLALNGTGITELTIPNTVTTIPDQAFANCKNLKTVMFEGSINIDRRSGTLDRAFEGCTSLENVTLPNDLTEIPYAMFRGCTALKIIVLPAGITKIGGEAFCGCSSLNNIELNDNISEIGWSCFENCSSLQAINWPEKCSVIDESVLRNCSSLSEVSLPETITKIEARAFRGCKKLRYITIPSKTKDIHFMAFGDEEERIPVTLYVTKGTYAHRYAEENSVSYLFNEYKGNEYPALWSTTTYGNFEGQPIEWMILAYCGDQYVMVSKYELANMCMNPIRTDMTWEQTMVYDWIENTFKVSAFSETEYSSIASVDLLSSGHFIHYVKDREICQKYFCAFRGKQDDIGWLKFEGVMECPYSTGFGNSSCLSEVPYDSQPVHPALYMKLNASPLNNLYYE